MIVLTFMSCLHILHASLLDISQVCTCLSLINLICFFGDCSLCIYSTGITKISKLQLYTYSYILCLYSWFHGQMIFEMYANICTDLLCLIWVVYLYKCLLSKTNKLNVGETKQDHLTIILDFPKLIETILI